MENSEIKEEIEEQFIQIAISLDIIESLSRILLDSIRDGSNLKPKDIENLTLTVYKNIKKTKDNFSLLESQLEFSTCFTVNTIAN